MSFHVPSPENCDLPEPVRVPGTGTQYATCAEKVCSFEYILVDMAAGPVWTNRNDFERDMAQLREREHYHRVHVDPFPAGVPINEHPASFVKAALNLPKKLTFVQGVDWVWVELDGERVWQEESWASFGQFQYAELGEGPFFIAFAESDLDH